MAKNVLLRENLLTNRSIYNKILIFVCKKMMLSSPPAGIAMARSEYAMTISSEAFYTIGLVLIGCAALLAATAVPILHITKARLEKRLENEYGKK